MWGLYFVFLFFALLNSGLAYLTADEVARENHSKTYMKKHKIGWRNIWFFEFFRDEIGKFRYVSLVVSYLILALFIPVAVFNMFGIFENSSLYLFAFSIIHIMLQAVVEVSKKVAEGMEKVNVIKMLFGILAAVVAVIGVVTFVIEFLVP